MNKCSIRLSLQISHDLRNAYDVTGNAKS